VVGPAVLRDLGDEVDGALAGVVREGHGHVFVGAVLAAEAAKLVVDGAGDDCAGEDDGGCWEGDVVSVDSGRMAGGTKRLTIATVE
jgi:hypothetical protein